MSESESNGVETFNLCLNEIPLQIRDEGGTIHKYTLRELSGTDRDRYLNEIGKRMGRTKRDAGQIKDVSGLPALLLSYSLYNSANERLKPAIIDSWPSAMQMNLFKKALRLSGLDNEEADMEAAKND